MADKNDLQEEQTELEDESSDQNNSEDQPEDGGDAPESGDNGQDESANDQEAEDEGQRQPSRRESLRIAKLVSKLKQQGSQDSPQLPQPGLKYKDILESDDPEVMTKLESDRADYGNQSYLAGLKQAQSIQFHTRLELDTPRVESKFPTFDKSSPKFNPQIVDAVNQWYLSTVGYDSKTGMVANADVRYAEFVEGIMELSDAMAGDKVATSTKNIAKQAASTGLRPSGGTAKRLNLNQAPQNMTDEELDAMIATAIPSKKR